MACTHEETYRAENIHKFKDPGEAIDPYRWENVWRLIKPVYDAALNNQPIKSAYQNLVLAA